MGQQQLLLLVLVFIIVGISVIVSIDIMQSTHDDANTTAIRKDILQAHSVAIAYNRRNVQTGGGGGSFAQIQLRDVMLPVRNENATYEITERTADSFRIIARPHIESDSLIAVISMNGITWE